VRDGIVAIIPEFDAARRSSLTPRAALRAREISSRHRRTTIAAWDASGCLSRGLQHAQTGPGLKDRSQRERSIRRRNESSVWTDFYD